MENIYTFFGVLVAAIIIGFLIWILISAMNDIFDSELRNLEKINRLGERTNALLYRRQELEKILREFYEIKTHEHSDKVAFYVVMINNLLNSKKI